MSGNDDFEPRLIGFLCRWCAYSGADLAGTSRMKYPANLIPVKVMCSGRVEPSFIFRALANGADGVLIAGCHPPADCHYHSGNIKAMRRFPLVRRTLQAFGVEPERVRLEWISASEGDRFAQVVAEMTETVRKLGPLNWGEVRPSRRAEEQEAGGRKQEAVLLLSADRPLPTDGRLGGHR